MTNGKFGSAIKEPERRAQSRSDAKAVGMRVENVRRNTHCLQILLGHRPAAQPMFLEQIVEESGRVRARMTYRDD